MGKSVNEVLIIVNEIFHLNLVELVGIDDVDILFGGGDYGISWDIMTQNIKIYHNGIQVAFISKYNLENYITDMDIDVEIYNKFINNLIINVNEDTINEIKRAEKKYVVFERYEDAQKLKEFLSQF